MRTLLLILAGTVFLVSFVSVSGAAAQQTVSFPTQDGGTIFADLYGAGDRGVVLAHGGRFSKESWQPQAVKLAAAGFRVLALDFRGFGESHGPADRVMRDILIFLNGKLPE